MAHALTKYWLLLFIAILLLPSYSSYAEGVTYYAVGNSPIVTPNYGRASNLYIKEPLPQCPLIKVTDRLIKPTTICNYGTILNSNPFVKPLIRNAAVTGQVDLSYTIHKELILAVHDGNNFSNHEVFANTTVPSSQLNYAGGLTTTPEFVLNGATFSNSDNIEISFGTSTMVLQHETTPTNTITVNLSTPTPGAQMNLPFVINKNTLISTKGVFQFKIEGKIDESTIDPQDTAGIYEGSMTISATIL